MDGVFRAAASAEAPLWMINDPFYRSLSTVDNNSKSELPLHATLPATASTLRAAE